MTRSLPSATPTALPTLSTKLTLTQNVTGSPTKAILTLVLVYRSREFPLPAKFSSRPFKFLLFCSVELQSYAAYGAVIARAFWMLLPDS